MARDATGIPEQCCYKCHFLCANVGPDDRPYFVTWAKRKNLLKGGEVAEALGKGRTLVCHEEMWDSANFYEDSTKDIPALLTADRHGRCLFYPYAPGVGFLAAVELEKRQAEWREAAKDRALTRDTATSARRASWAAVTAAVIGALALVSAQVWEWWRLRNAGPTESPPAITQQEGPPAENQEGEE